MKIVLKKGIYPIDAILRAAYVFTDRAYIVLDEDEESIIVDFENKSTDEELSINEGEFKNELLAQLVRNHIHDSSKRVRELIYQRAMSSSMLMTEPIEEKTVEIDYDIEEILRDWFSGERQ